jgi:hypothetical protein
MFSDLFNMRPIGDDMLVHLAFRVHVHNKAGRKIAHTCPFVILPCSTLTGWMKPALYMLRDKFGCFFELLTKTLLIKRITQPQKGNLEEKSALLSL